MCTTPALRRSKMELERERFKEESTPQGVPFLGSFSNRFSDLSGEEPRATLRPPSKEHSRLQAGKLNMNGHMLSVVA